MKILLTLPVLIFMPMFAGAQTPQNFRDVSDMIVGFLSSLLPVLVGFALVVFFWGLITYIWHASDSADAHARGRQLMFWGILALFVMLSLWGVIEFLQVTLFGQVLSSLQ